MAFLFNNSIKNNLSNFIPHETVTCNDRDPLCINKNIMQLREKNVFQEKNDTYRSYILNDKILRYFITQIIFKNSWKNLIEHSQEKYHICVSKKKKMDPMITIKTYWSLLKT